MFAVRRSAEQGDGARNHNRGQYSYAFTASMDKSGRQLVARYHFADDTIKPSTTTVAVLPMP